MGLAFNGSQGADTFSISPIAGLAVNRTSIAMACWFRNPVVSIETLVFALWKKSSFEKFHLDMLANGTMRAVYEYASGVSESVSGNAVSASWQPCMIRISGSSGTFTKMEIWVGAAQTTPTSTTISRSNVSAQLDRIIVGDGDSSDVAELIIWGNQDDTQAQAAWDSFKTGALPENVDSARQVTGATLVDATSPSLTLYNSLGSLSTYGGTVATSSTHPVTRSGPATITENLSLSEQTVGLASSDHAQAESTTVAETVSATVTAGSQGSIISEPLKRNNGTLAASSALNYVALYDRDTNALVLRKTGLATNALGVVSFTDPAVVQGVDYRIDWEEASGQRRMPIRRAE